MEMSPPARDGSRLCGNALSSPVVPVWGCGRYRWRCLLQQEFGVISCSDRHHTVLVLQRGRDGTYIHITYNTIILALRIIMYNNYNYTEFMYMHIKKWIIN